MTVIYVIMSFCHSVFITECMHSKFLDKQMDVLAYLTCQQLVQKLRTDSVDTGFVMVKQL